ncbi:HTH domain-containing protein [Aestuariibaculum sediminum]|uniref:Helix-turn-helix type 11 domain-containing protein n=1 Tax=Aestuariibaculum sediminum TaxID=2770637 RepID=A0A8J6Q3I3_9FLAO|nr:HTH domain-containing protein [Aestuariibaculum sediminum]MBD0833719.1 hypothetical protein [Aestuariibaculum sediminum]
MTYAERKEKEEYLLYLIKQKRLYSLKEVADNFDCSERTLKRIIFHLRDEGYNIKYCRKKHKYFLEE